MLYELCIGELFGWVINQDVHFELKLVRNRVDR
jgi:hypothetical protein